MRVPGRSPRRPAGIRAGYGRRVPGGGLTLGGMRDRRDIAALVGWSAVVFSVLYLVSDVIEEAQGGFSTGQLWLTLVAEAAIPPIVLGLYAMQRPRIGRIGLVGAVAYAAAYVFFTATVVVALVEDTPDFETLSDDLSPWMTVGGAVMVLAGIAFAVGVVRAGVLPRWTAAALALGVVLVAATSGLSGPLPVAAAGVRDLGIAAMGAALALRGASRPIRSRRRSGSRPA